MLRAMGWREGRGVGLANSKKYQRGDGDEHTTESDFDREQIARIAPEFELTQEDVLISQLQPMEGVHGLGYEGLRPTTVLDQSYGRMATTLKMKEKSRGIRGQAFGVGAFEDEDENVYSQYDLSQFNFSLDGPEGESETSAVDATFIQATKRLNSRTFYAPPKLPPNFKPEHRSIVLNSDKLPEGLREAMKNMTVIQRAKYFDVSMSFIFLVLTFLFCKYHIPGNSTQTGRRDEDKLSAVRIGMFGERTRTSFKWYPDNLLAKRFNVPNPYPDAGIVGVPQLQKVNRKETILNLGLPNTANELLFRREDKSHRVEKEEELKEDFGKKQREETDEEVEKPPVSIFDAIFGNSSSDTEEEEEENIRIEPQQENVEIKNDENKTAESSVPSQKIITVMDLDEEFGPAPPPCDNQALSGFSMLRYLKEEMDRKKAKKASHKKHKSKKLKKEKKVKSKKSRKEKKSKSKKTKKSRRDQSESSFDDSSSDDDNA
uniref:G-patch domain-containing protein n=1 Tax=Heterorhabditis bacteriophora TaxID=37862 RepID=A0A1I7XRY8_HETBA